MPTVSTADGAAIHYEVFGSGYPLVLIAPGGVNSEITFWERSILNPITLFRTEFRVIGIDQRHAGESRAPLKPFSYDDAVADVLSVLDDAGVERAHVWGGCIGCAYAWHLLERAPARFSAAVCQDPVGLDETNSTDVFYRMFEPTFALARERGVEAVIASARENPLFVVNNAGGPFARRIAADAGFAAEVAALGTDGYIRLIEDFRTGIWPPNPPYFTVSEEWMQTCETPVLVIPGNDPFHPTSVGRRVCRQARHARCLDVDARSPENVDATVATIRAFLHEHSV